MADNQFKFVLRFFKTIAGMVTILVAALAVLVVFSPSIASTSWGQQQIIKLINAQIPGTIEISSLRLSWFGQQVIKGGILKDPAGKAVLTVESLQLGIPLFDLLLNDIEGSKIQVQGLNATLEQNEHGITNLQYALGRDDLMPSMPLPPAGKSFVITLTDADAIVQLPTETESLHAKLHGFTKHGETVGQFSITASEERLAVDIDNFPVLLIDHLVSIQDEELNGLIHLALGETLDMSIEQKQSAQGIQLAIQAKSANLNADFLGTLRDDAFLLSQPGRATLIVTPELIELFKKRQDILPGFSLLRPTQLDVEITQLFVPASFIEQPVKQGQNRLAVQADVRLAEADLASNNSPLEMTLKRMLINVQAPQNSTKANLSISGEAIREKLPMQFNLQATVDKPIHIDTLVDSLLYKSEVKAELKQLPLSLMESLLDKNLLHLIGADALISLKIDGSTSNHGFNAMIVASPIILHDLPQLGHVGIHDLSAVVKGNFDKEVLQLLLKGELKPVGQGLLSSVFGGIAHMSIDASLQRDEEGWDVYPLKAELTSRLLHSTLEGRMMRLSSNNPEGAISIAFKGDQIQGKMALKIDEDITLQSSFNPIVIQATLTPERFAFLRNLFGENGTIKHLMLKQPAQMTASIYDLVIPWQASAPFLQATLAGDIKMDSLSITDGRQETIHFENMTAKIENQGLTKEINLEIKADEKHDSMSASPFMLSAKIENLLTDNGLLNSQDLSLNFNIRSHRLPAALIAQIACCDLSISNKLEALFGKKIKTDIQAKLHRMNGTFKASLRGENGWLNLDGQLTNGTITLLKPFELEVAVSPQLGRSILLDVLPVLSGVSHAENPIKITVDPQGFAFFVHPMDIKQLQIGRATIQLGKMTFEKEGELGTVFELLKQASHEELSVWFTPLYLDVKDGVLTLNRVDILLMNRYPLALWGTVDFPKDKVNTRIGITPAALSHALKLTGLENMEMLQIPLTGTIGNASIDKAQAATRISAIVAQNQGSPQGLLIGTFLDIASGGLKETPAPSSTTNPLPWADQMQSLPAAREEEGKAISNDADKKKHSKKVSPIEKVAANLLDDFIKS